MLTGYVVTGIVVLVTLAWVGIGATRVWRQAGRDAAAVQPLPRTKIRDIAAGARVRVIGIAVGHDDYAKAPYSGTECLAFHGERSATVGTDDAPARVDGPSTDEIRTFHVEDDTGTIELAFEHVTLKLVTRDVSGAVAAEHVFGAKLLARDAVATTYREALLLPDDRVVVIGTAERRGDGKLRLTGTAEVPLVISNEPLALLS